MAASSRFAEVSNEEISEIKISAVPKTTQNATKYGINLFKEWFAQQNEFTTEFEAMEIEEMNNCLSKFYLSARRKDGSHYKRTSLLSIRAALDRHLRSPPFNKKFSICDGIIFNEANKALSSYLKHLSSTGKIAGTVHKNPLTAGAVQKLFEAGELQSAETRNPRILLQTTWFYVSLYFGKRGRENQSVMKKSMLRLAVTASGQEYFELNKDEPGAVLSTKKHTGGLDGTEDHADGKIFASPNSSKCPVQTIKAYLSHLNPDVDALFQRPKNISVRFDPEKDKVWFEKKVLGHNTLENMLRSMTEKAGMSPYYTNHSLRATTVTVLSSNNVETRQIKAVTGHRSDASIESYCERPTLHQFQHMSSTLTSFIHGNENTPPATASSSASDPTRALSTSGTPAERILPTTASSISASQNDANFLLSNGVNPRAILPSGNFHGCSFTFNINVNK